MIDWCIHRRPDGVLPFAAVALVLFLALGARVPSAGAEPLSMTFTEARANVGKQLFDAALFQAPDRAPLAAEIDPGSGSITGGILQVPEFQTHIINPINADVSVNFEIGVVSGSFDRATGALTLEGKAGGMLRSVGTPSGEEGECRVATVPEVLKLSTSGSSGGANPRLGVPFAAGLTGPGAIAGTWTDMTAVPVTPEDPDEETFCSNVHKYIGGEGGVWLEQEDIVAPLPPQLTGTDPASPGASGAPRIRGNAEPGSTVRLYAGSGCAGVPVAITPAAALGSPGIAVAVAEGATASFSATATDAAGNVSSCSAPIAYTHLRPVVPPPVQCVVPKLKGQPLRRARRALQAAHCKVGKVHKPKHRKGRGHVRLVVKRSRPAAGKILAAGSRISLTLVPKPRKVHREAHRAHHR